MTIAFSSVVGVSTTRPPLSAKSVATRSHSNKQQQQCWLVDGMGWALMLEDLNCSPPLVRTLHTTWIAWTNAVFKAWPHGCLLLTVVEFVVGGGRVGGTGRVG